MDLPDCGSEQGPGGSFFSGGKRVDSWKQTIFPILRLQVSVETVAPIIQAADRWDSPTSQLKHRCMEFIIQNYEAVVTHPEFEELRLDGCDGWKCCVEAKADPMVSHACRMCSGM